MSAWGIGGDDALGIALRLFVGVAFLLAVGIGILVTAPLWGPVEFWRHWGRA